MKLLVVSRIVRVLAEFVLLRYRDWWSLRELAERHPSKLGCVFRKAYDLFCDRRCASIPLSVKFVGKPCFPHGISGIFISRNTRIGKDAVIFQQVTIGSNTLKEAGGSQGKSPVLGDYVYIGAGAKIIGDVCVGDNCRIGANACVYRNVSPHSVCVSAPTRIIQKENLDNTFYSNELYGSLFFRDGRWQRVDR